jgi:hypothetical protein
MATQDAQIPRRISMLVPVSLVGCVTVPVVDVIDVVTVRDSLMPTAVGVGMLMVGVLHMRQVPLVIVIVVGAMGVAIVDVVDMPVVLDRRMSAAGPVLMGVVFMHVVHRRTHGFSLVIDAAIARS